MIQGFEEQTAPLTEYERTTLLPMLVKCIERRKGADMAVTNTRIVKAFREHGYTLSEARVRKLVNHIRINGLVPRLVASSRGYYVTDDMNELRTFLQSLRGREEAIRAVRIAMEKQLSMTLF